MNSDEIWYWESKPKAKERLPNFFDLSNMKPKLKQFSTDRSTVQKVGTWYRYEEFLSSAFFHNILPYLIRCHLITAVDKSIKTMK